MFLGAGSVMHGMNDDVNMRHYGALARAMPITFVTFAAGYLAIIGFPFFSGYYSKDHDHRGRLRAATRCVGVLAMLGAGMTAFYMTRLMLMTFLGQKRWLEGVHPHESPAVMTVPLIILGVLLPVRRADAEQLDRRLAGSGRRIGDAEDQRRACCTSPCSAWSRWSWWRSAWLIAVLVFGPPQGDPGDRAAEPVPVRAGRPQRPVRRRVQRGGVHATRSAADHGLVRVRGRAASTAR